MSSKTTAAANATLTKKEKTKETVQGGKVDGRKEEKGSKDDGKSSVKKTSDRDRNRDRKDGGSFSTDFRNSSASFLRL